MKRESVLEQLKAVKDGDFSAALDFILAENGKDINATKAAAKATKDELESVKTQLASLQEEKDKATQASMTQEQQIQKQLEDLAKAKAELDRRSNRVDAASKLAEAGITGDDAEKILNSVVTSDAKVTSATVSALVDVFNSQKAVVEANTKKSLMANTLTPPNNASGTKSVTQKEFNAMTYTQRLQVFNENPDLYKHLVEGE